MYWLLQNMIEGGLIAMRGYREAMLAAQPHAVPTADVVDRLCAPLGWKVHEKRGITSDIRITDDAGDDRVISVWPVADGQHLFLVSSMAVFGTLPPSVSEYLLVRNTYLNVGSWMSETASTGVMVCLIHRAHLDSLNAVEFHNICAALIREAHDFDGKLRTAGMLR